MSDLSPEHDSLVQAIVSSLDKRDARLRSASDSQWGTIKRLLTVKDVVAAIVFLGGLIGGGYVAFERISSKPDREDVIEAIEVRIQPVEDVATQNAEAVEKVKDDVGDVKQKVNRIESVNEVMLEQNAYQGEVLEHVAGNKRGLPPQKPEALKAKEMELMR
jgi:ribulose 1,5-bisphosphate synthetase/thiazole synthase